jgi:hypothetical protein
LRSQRLAIGTELDPEEQQPPARAIKDLSGEVEIRLPGAAATPSIR